ncbi:MAG TPA: hypothetical protein DCF33_22770 [Saprospirales bacterium]|nr:hypothetical protein [Saprospirales bacterium]
MTEFVAKGLKCKNIDFPGINYHLTHLLLYFVNLKRYTFFGPEMCFSSFICLTLTVMNMGGGRFLNAFGMTGPLEVYGIPHFVRNDGAFGSV